MKKSKWSDQKMRTLELLMMSPVERAAQGLPVTLEEIAGEVGYGVRYVQSLRANLPELKRELLSFSEGEEESLTHSDYEAFMADLKITAKGNPAAARLYAELMGYIKKGPGEESKLSGDNLTRIVAAAERELESEGFAVRGMDANGVGKVPEERQVLSD